ncbi:hypothetical protein [Marinilabilia salmonicolor]|uniref:hypothetical protein n=1 Tax=Marinilabilia salmonicolor TaxID=989 RepID=UPI00029A6B91|nr:hypothetical protein [Marinilabilia salmonicolor]
MNSNSTKYSVNLGFEEVKLPPFEDILIVGRKSQQGKRGVTKLFELLVPNEFETVDLEHPNVEVVFVNRRILKKIELNHVMEILKEKVIPYISPSEILKVDFQLKVHYDTIEIDI